MANRTVSFNTKTEIEPSKQLSVGKSEGPIIDLPLGTKETALFVLRDGWPDLGKSDVVEIRQFYSMDGVNWEIGGISTHWGGEWISKTGAVMSQIPFVVAGVNPEVQVKYKYEIYSAVPVNTRTWLLARDFETLPKVKQAG